MRYIALITVAAALMLPAPAARAIPMTFGGVLSAANETPPNSSPGAGTVTVVLDPTAQTLTILASFFGLTTPDTAAHIHCCQTTPGTPPTVRGRHHSAYLWSSRAQSRVPVGSDLRHI